MISQRKGFYEETERMKVSYIHHSSFYIQFEKKVLVFDYYDGRGAGDCSYEGKMPDFPRDTELYVFASHGHRDHFDMEVLRWSYQYPKIHYIFAKEIKKKLGNSALRRIFPDRDIQKIKETIHYMKPAEQLEIAGVSVETLLSTDSGVAFLVTCEGKTIYHAGDLNWWHWEGESEEDNRYQENTYKEQIGLLSEKNIDVAFVVLDPRQGKDMFQGIEYFIHHVKAGYVVPMHMWKQYGYISKYKDSLKDRELAERIVELQEENQECFSI